MAATSSSSSSSSFCFKHLSPSLFSTMEASSSSSSSSSFCFSHLSPSYFENMEPESSPLNPEETLIKFDIYPVSLLKKAGSVLHDFGFVGLGRLDINDNGFEVTIRDAQSSSGAAYRLFIPSSNLLDFHCTKPVVNKFIEVSRLYSLTQLHTYPRSRDYTTLTITHVKGDESLIFEYDCYPHVEFRLKFCTSNLLFVPRFPVTTFFCEALLPSKILKQLTERLNKHRKTEIVALEIKAERVNVYIDYIEDVFPWTVECVNAREEAEITRTTHPVGGEETEITSTAQSLGTEAVETRTTEPVHSEEALQGETRIIKPGQTHHTWIKMRHCSVLDKASLLGGHFSICLCSEPADKVIMKFNIEGLGEYQFLNETLKVLPQYDERAVCLKLLLFSPLLDTVKLWSSDSASFVNTNNWF